MYKNFQKPYGQMSTGATWRDQLQTIKIAREEYAKAVSYSDTPGYIADSLRHEIEDKIQAVRPTIIKASIAEHAEKIDGFKKARSKVQEAVANEIRRWDARQLLDQMELTRARVQAVLDIGVDAMTKRSPGPGLEAIYQEAKESGDPVRLRAAGEVFKSVLYSIPIGYDQETRQAANHLQFRAEEELRQLKETDELKAAHEAEKQAWNDLTVMQDELIETSKVLEGDDPTNPFVLNDFARAVRRVRLIDGEPDILEPNDPEVTGINLKFPME